MKQWRFVLLIFFLPAFLVSNQETFSSSRLDDFYNEFSCEQKDDLHDAGLTSSCADDITTPVPPTPPPPPPPPPVNPIPPSPITGMLPVVIDNTATGLSADDVYVTLAGAQVKDGTQYFFQLDSSTGVFTPVAASQTTYSATYSYPLSSLPTSTTGADHYLVYAPALNGARFYFSIRRPIYLQVNNVNNIVAPFYYAFYDPNYNNLYETVEITFKPTGGSTSPGEIPWTASVNTTEVDAFCFPIRIGYFSFDALNPNDVTPLVQDPNALPSGFGVGGLAGATTRSGILTSVTTGLSSGDLSGQGVWSKLAIPFYSDPYTPSGMQTYLRVLSPKQSVGADANPPEVGNLTPRHINTVNGNNATTFYNYNYPPFPLKSTKSPDGYLQSAIFTGNPTSFAEDLFSYYSSGTNLYISTGGMTPTVYEGVISGSPGSYVFTFTGQAGGPNAGQVSTLAQTDINTFKMYSGSQIMTGGADGDNLGFFFGDAFTVGILPSAVGTSPGDPINITDATPSGWESTYVPQYYSPINTVPGGPWYSLYAKEFHKVAVRNTSTTFLNNYGLCYAYDFDDSLGISGTITPKNPTSSSLNPYLGITLGAIDTTIPDSYSDANSYDVTFVFPFGRSISYQQGNGPITPIAVSGTTVTNLMSNSSNPLRLYYTVPGQGSGVFIAYLYYQFLVPENKYTNFEVSVINSTQLIPESSTPSKFTINLQP